MLNFDLFDQNIDRMYMLEPPRRGGSNEYPQSMFWNKDKKNRHTCTPVNPSFAMGHEGVYFSWVHMFSRWNRVRREH